MVKELLGRFIKKNCKKVNQTEFKMEKVVKKKVIKYMLGGKVFIIRFSAG